jgi:hypothetical protein
MAPLLTAASVLMCPHGGTVTAITAGPRPTADAPLLLAPDTCTVAGCAFTLPGPVPSPCVLAMWVGPDVMTAATIGPTLSLTSTALCISALGVPQGPVVVAGTQPTVLGS